MTEQNGAGVTDDTIGGASGTSLWCNIRISACFSIHMSIARFAHTCGSCSARMRSVSDWLLRFGILPVPNKPQLVSAGAQHDACLSDYAYLARHSLSPLTVHLSLTTLQPYAVEVVVEIHSAASVLQLLLISSRKHLLVATAELLDDITCDDTGLIRRSGCGGLLCAQDDIPATCLLYGITT